MDCPVFLTILLTVTSLESTAKVLSALQKVRVTDASWEPLYVLFPEKMRFAAFAALILLMLNLPNTKQSASVMFDFPEPFGPTMMFIELSRGISVFWAKDLNPLNIILFMCVMKWGRDVSYIKIIGSKELFLGGVFCFD